jgi:hypothetical protein
MFARLTHGHGVFFARSGGGQQELQVVPLPFSIFLAWMTSQTYTRCILPAEANAPLGSWSGDELVFWPSDVHSFSIQFHDAIELVVRDVLLYANVMDRWGEPDPLTHRRLGEIEAVFALILFLYFLGCQIWCTLVFLSLQVSPLITVLMLLLRSILTRWSRSPLLELCS